MPDYLVKSSKYEDVQTSYVWPRIMLACVLLGLAGWGIWTYTQSAPSAYQAMALGQYSRAHDLYLEEAQSGNPSAQNALGNLYYLGLGVDLNYTSARDWYFAAAKSGFGDAQLNMGHLYKQGLGVAHDPVRAFGWYNQAHKHGDPAAEYYLTQITVEWTISPLMIDAAQTKWSKLEALVKEPL